MKRAAIGALAIAVGAIASPVSGSEPNKASLVNRQRAAEREARHRESVARPPVRERLPRAYSLDGDVGGKDRELMTGDRSIAEIRRERWEEDTLLGRQVLPRSGESDAVAALVERLRGETLHGVPRRRHETDLVRPSVNQAERVQWKQVRNGFSDSIIKTIEVRDADAEEPVLRVESAESGDGGGRVVEYTVDPASRLVFERIAFRPGSVQFDGELSKRLVHAVGRALNAPELADAAFVVEGHASAEGDEADNLRLSRERAETVVRTLVEVGVNERRLLAVGLGEREATHPETAPERLLRTDRKMVIYRLVSR